ncbi:MAG: hypothetical protein ACM3O3_06680 [Syntrophothermus sp.]
MGQQQLLLIVLGVIIVGVAIVAGIGLFNAGSEESVKDETVSQLMNIGANAQQWFKKPVAMGGGGNSFTTSNGATVAYTIPPKLSYTSNCGKKVGGTITAGYTITSSQAGEIKVTANPNDYTWNAIATINDTSITTTIQ